eukprot:comp45083_c0_seq1/m.47534 comp45083_c0_seq1/g.47534  ORF comp45083_c0_seq1/g.47534 comp45083_c0_seq1/m.47534 type:complete len:113 (-) comp45083_c0_seq1:216-554(-)
MGRKRKDKSADMMTDEDQWVDISANDQPQQPNPQKHADVFVPVKGVERHGKQVFKAPGALPKAKKKGVVKVKQKRRQEKLLQKAVDLMDKKDMHFEKLNHLTAVKEKAKHLY